MTNARRQRLQEAKNWFASQNFTDDSHIVKAYRERFNVDKDCAMRELCLLKVLSPDKQEAYEKALKAKKQKRSGKSDEYPEELSAFQDENFAFIAGYTPAGFPFGITWEEQERLDQMDSADLSEDYDDSDEEITTPRPTGKGFSDIDVYELPF